MSNMPAGSDILAKKGYRVVSRLGKGASGAVYLATTGTPSLQVAIKAIPRRMKTCTPQQRDILVDNEITLSWKLFHPYLITVYETFADPHNDYIVMEYVAGGDLQPYTRPDHLLAIDDVLAVSRKCCLALGYASRCGVIHRDLKPGNILRAGATDIRISDFGGAIFGNLDKSVIADFGSPAYMSPEQIHGDPLDARSDMFSLGVVLYQLLTGILPFDASDPVAVFFKILHEPCQPVEVLRPDLPAGLANTVNRALAKNRSERFPTWEVFAHGLGETGSWVPASVATTTPGRRIEAVQLLGIPLFDGLNADDIEAIAAKSQLWDDGVPMAFLPGPTDIAYVTAGRVETTNGEETTSFECGDLLAVCGVQPRGAQLGQLKLHQGARIAILSLLDLCENPKVLGVLLPRLMARLRTGS